MGQFAIKMNCLEHRLIQTSARCSGSQTSNDHRLLQNPGRSDQSFLSLPGPQQNDFSRIKGFSTDVSRDGKGLNGFQ